MNCIFCKTTDISYTLYKDIYCKSCKSRQYYCDGKLLVSSFSFDYNSNSYKIINRHYLNMTIISKGCDKIFTSNKLLNLTPQNINAKINIILGFI